MISIPVCAIRPALRAIYSSEGLLHSLHRNVAPQSSFIFHFAGRPVAQLDLSGGTESWKWLTADHLGTPIAATGSGGALLWQGGFEPFGADWSGAGGAGVFLRFPGQWEEGAWGNASLETGMHYNVHRWYERERGRYTSPDPEWGESTLLEQRTPAALGQFLYSSSLPTVESDPLGLLSFNYHKTCKGLPESKRSALENAVSEAAQYAPLTPPCKAKPREKVKVKCGSCGGDCGRQLGGTICINLDKVQNGECGTGPKCLASTVLHEVVHTCGGSETDSYACEKRFYKDTCRFQTPSKYQPKPECPNPCG